MSTSANDNVESSDIPSLDFDSSTITSASPADMSGLNPHAPCFQYDETMAFLDQEMPLYGSENPALGYTYPVDYGPVNDDIRWMLMSLSSRLARLEETVLTGNAQMHQFHSKVTDIMNKSITAMEEFSDTISNLKKSLKHFMQALIGQTLGNLDCVEVQSEV
ncbi:hypothetical protein TGAMA5MH_00239 [Trichoderma gamsii]|uniref:Uncharacterized protein n=1 Tax=Trichoderma gamsii TaxID=398673 RepID=A0A2K0TTD4_9HYPO|nr:hypothetical protein TGAMA5MH_00239 [Trichoderma gamsii]